jgi:hypothetical protein
MFPSYPLISVVTVKNLGPKAHSLASSQRRKTLEIKIKDGNPSIKSTRQMRTQVDTTPKKIKNPQKSGKDLMQRELVATK